jgi:DNA-binding SARP family transcriptional activator
MVSVPQRAFLPSRKSSIHPYEREHQAHYRAYLFGQFRFFQGKQSIAEEMRRRSKAGTLLKWFLLNSGTLGSADQLLDLFWPDVSSETAFGNLHVTMHYLRRLLEPTLMPRQESKFIRRQANNFYSLHLDETWWIDTIEVQHLFHTAREMDQRGYDVKASFYYRKVISYCSLGFLPEDTAEEWLTPHRRRYERLYSQVLQRMIQFCTQRGEWEDIIDYAYQALSIDPYCEPATRAIIDAYLQQGNVSAAHHALNDFYTFFQKTLGIEPGREFYLLRDRIMKASN